MSNLTETVENALLKKQTSERSNIYRINNYKKNDLREVAQKSSIIIVYFSGIEKKHGFHEK